MNGDRHLRIILASALILILGVACLKVDAQPPFKEPDWSTPDHVYDLAVSADGSLVAAATHGGLKVYDASGGILWSWSPQNVQVKAVDVSDDGNVVVATAFNSTSEEYRLFFWKNAKTLSGTPQPDWRSKWLAGIVEDETEALAVSSDGNQVVVVGTGEDVYYWNNTLSLSGFDVEWTWQFIPD